MKRLPFLFMVVFLGCGEWKAHKEALRFDKTWIGGEAEIARRNENEIEVTIRLRLGDAAAFANDFKVAPPYAFPCQRVRLLYRTTPQSAPQFLQTRWSDAPAIWSDEPGVCLHAGTEWTWRVLVARERGSLPLDAGGHLVLISGKNTASTEQIAVVVLRTPESPDDFEKAVRGEVRPFITATSRWLRLAS